MLPEPHNHDPATAVTLPDFGIAVWTDWDGDLMAAPLRPDGTYDPHEGDLLPEADQVPELTHAAHAALTQAKFAKEQADMEALLEEG